MTFANVRRTPAPHGGLKAAALAVLSAVIMGAMAFASAHAQTDPVARGLAAGLQKILPQGSAVPLAPTNVLAQSQNGSAVVTWSAPPLGSPTLYVVTASPGGASATSTGTNATVSGLTNGTAYTFTVVAKNGSGSSVASSASNSVTPSAPISGMPSVSGLIEQLAADQLTGYTNGASVPTFTDVSGNGYSAIQTTGAKQPTYVASWTNGKPALAFNGSGQTMLLNNLTQAKIGSAMTIFLVADLTSSLNSSSEKDQRLLCNQTGVLDSYKFDTDMYAGSGNAFRTLITGSSASSAAISLSTPYILSVTSPGYQYVNGAKTATQLNAVYKDNGAYYLGSMAGTLRYYTGRVAELIIFNRVLTDTERHSVESYLSTKYAVSVVAQ